MPVLNKKPNLLHHNTGRRQHPKTQLAGKLNWFRLQVMGAQANLQHGGFDVSRDPMFSKLKPEVRDRLLTAIQQARNVAMQLKDVAEEIASLNGPDKWVD